VSTNLEEEGEFVIEVSVVDISGRETTATLNVVLDKTGPFIQYVEQLNGKHIPYFQWNYQPEELIHDNLDFQYDMELNRGRYLTGTLIDSEGDYLFQVNARDAAGNDSSVYAAFTIDNTPPKIYFYNVNHDESYEKEIMLGVAVTELGERIRQVEVNGEIASIDRDNQMVQLRFSRADDYIITATADDLAGNTSIEEIRFSIVAEDDNPEGADENVNLESGRQMDRIIEKIGAILPDGVSREIEERLIMKVLLGACILLGAGGAGLLIYKKMKKVDTSHK
jgi:hypothetical protein